MGPFLRPCVMSLLPGIFIFILNIITHRKNQLTATLKADYFSQLLCLVTVCEASCHIVSLLLQPFILANTTSGKLL